TEQVAIPPLEFTAAGKTQDTVPIPSASTTRYFSSQFYSEKHQWLPTDFDVTSEGKVKAKSYINNLHPAEHKEMYPVLEEILERFLPMFEEVLSEIQHFWFKPRTLTTDRDWYGSEPEFAEGHSTDSDEDEDENEEGDGDGGAKPVKTPKEPKEPKEPKKPKKEYFDSREYYETRLPLPIPIPDFTPREDLPRYNLKSLATPLQ
ncbi:hypothetical protein BGX24_007619, partial [Mortierella sp. AD032]